MEGPAAGRQTDTPGHYATSFQSRSYAERGLLCRGRPDIRRSRAWSRSPSTSGGTMVIELLYDPRYGDPPPPWGSSAGEGSTSGARIYWDVGTGTIDFGAPVSTLSLDGPVLPARHAWAGGELPPGATCFWVVQIVTVNDIETQNTRAVSATAASSASPPATPDIAAVVL